MSEKDARQTQQWKQQPQKISSYEQQSRIAFTSASLYGGAIEAVTYAAPTMSQTTTTTLTMISPIPPTVRFPIIQHTQPNILTQSSHVPSMTGVDLSSTVPPPSLPSNNTTSSYPANIFEPYHHQQQQQQQYDLNKMITSAMHHPIPGNQLTAASVSGQQQLPIAKQPVMLGIISAPSISVENPTTSNQAITQTVASENVLNLIGSKASVESTHLASGTIGITSDDDKIHKIQNVIESGLSDSAKQQIASILEKIQSLKPVERLLLYLRMPGETSEPDPLRHPQNPLGTRSEINHTINWVRTHLEHDPQVSIPKQDVYNDYNAYCERLNIKPLSTADFGKVMKQVFPEIRPRRLGTRGHSRYCYAAMRKTTNLNPPQLPILSSQSNPLSSAITQTKGNITPSDCGNISLNANYAQDDNSWNIIKSWAEVLLNVKLDNVKDLADHIAQQKSTTPGQNPRNSLQKKYSQRGDAKADTGPLKKRRKKKRKGSSSSESSSIATSTTAAFNLSSTTTLANSIYVANEDDQKSAQNLISIKEEKIESPIFHSAHHHMPGASGFDANRQQSFQNIDLETNPMRPENTIHHISHQLMPMNLATDTKLTCNQAPTPLVMTSAITPAVKNLTHEIINLSSNANVCPAADATEHLQQLPIIKEEVLEDYSTSNVICKKVRKAYQTKGLWIGSPASSAPTSVIASTSNLTTVSTPPPQPPPSQLQPSSTTIESIDMQQQSSPIVDNFMMGPPAPQITLTVSTNANVIDNPSSTSTIAPAAKVASRNTQQLRARKLRYLQARAELYSSYQQNPGAAMSTCQQQQQSQIGTASDGSDIIAEDKDVLPENLGLPRERVISICNMDKQELDDYLNGDEDNSQDQEAELLQYFQTGDAEYNKKQEKQLDANNPSTVSVSTDDQRLTEESTIGSTTTTTTTTATTLKESFDVSEERNEKKSLQVMKCASTRGDDITHLRHYLHQNFPKETDQLYQVKTQMNYMSSNEFAVSSKINSEIACESVTTPLTMSGNGGSNSASLANIPQKHLHQEQPQKHIQKQQQQRWQEGKQQQQIKSRQQQKEKTIQCIKKTKSQKISNIRIAQQKRKINLNATTAVHHKNKGNVLDATVHQKNYIFLPISPNINSNNSNELFASPGAARPRAKPTFNKQQSLPLPSINNDSEIMNTRLDPMIGSGICGKRSLFQTSNSASAPPSPSQQQQHKQQQQCFSRLESVANITRSKKISKANIFSDPNSLDCILDDTSSSHEFRNGNCGAAGNAALTVQSVIETSSSTRSQSVPLQYRSSPQFNQADNFTAFSSTCSSVAQTPIPSEFADFSDPTSIFNLFTEQSSASDVTKNDETTNAGANVETTSIAEPTMAALLLDDIDVTDMLSPDFVTSCSTTPSSVISKFDAMAQISSTTTTTTLSSGYSSNSGDVGCIGFGTNVSRSVPSTPLPHNILDAFLKKQRSDEIGDCLSLFQYSDFLSNNMRSSVSGSLRCTGMNRMYDMSKSMPTTPITSNAATPSFRYSPEFNRDFLINGNTVDSVTSTSMSAYSRTNNSTAPGTETLMNLTENLLDSGQNIADNLPTPSELNELASFTEVPDSIMGTDILDSL